MSHVIKNYYFNYLFVSFENYYWHWFWVRLSNRRWIYFQHDGAPAHYDRNVRAYLNTEFGGRWIGRGGPIAWPPRSPDLTPLDFHLWGRAKDLVYGNDGHTIRTVDELYLRIVNAFAVMASERDILNRVKRHVIKRAAMCIRRRGRHIQQLMWTCDTPQPN